MPDEAKLTITDVIRSLIQAPGVVAARSRIWFEEKGPNNSWWVEMLFPAKPFAFVARLRLQRFFEQPSRLAAAHGYYCYFRYLRLLDLDYSGDDGIAVQIHIVSFNRLEVSELRVIPGLSLSSRETLFTLNSIKWEKSDEPQPAAAEPGVIAVTA